MPSSTSQVKSRPKSPEASNGLRRFLRSSEGAAALEFALLAIPYFMIIFAILETFIAFAGEQLLSSTTDLLSRKMRTGQITFNMGRSTDMNTELQFRQAVCNEISIIMKCSATEAAIPSKLYVDVQAYSSFAAIPKGIPRVSSATFSDLDVTKFKYAPGGPGTINMMRIYYRWQIITDLVRPYITTIRPADGSMPRDFLIIGTAAYQNEQYP